MVEEDRLAELGGLAQCGRRGWRIRGAAGPAAAATGQRQGDQGSPGMSDHDGAGDAEGGVLPWTGLLNIGFGFLVSGDVSAESERRVRQAVRRAAAGEIVLGDELSEWKRIQPAQARYWPGGTGFALRDWLRTRGHEPESFQLP